MLISTYGQLTVKNNQKDLVRDVGDDGHQVKWFQYTEVIANHYKFHGTVHDHNNHQHDSGGTVISIKDTWRTTKWEICIFCFVCLAITEVNAYLTCKFLSNHDELLM